MADTEDSAPEWRVIPGFCDYEASSDGRIRRATPAADGRTHQVGREMKQSLGNTGYYRISLRLNGDLRGKHFSVHRLVALAFLGTPQGDRDWVAHNDGTRTNNRPENLRWATPAENQADRLVHGTDMRGKKHHQAKLGDDDVRAIRKACLESPGYGTGRALALKYDVDPTLISMIRLGKIWKHIE